MVTTTVYKPATNLEIIFIIIAGILNCGIFGYLINRVGNILDNIYKKSSNARK